ncbi:NADH:flavin oxidoreductase/NADH oxidase family protein [Alteribacter keqinensis]|uniref:NADH:flavin oxidoreductase/NADH oxidase family protein n=1 Tax=Alteribacter keqinensis TaxID=2483800 RepID=A0A3M7TX31_9BACI|nr:NADH:flavin oxidoreductase/NADH oxidase family protein [Alteribacter keqinensis]RNA70180.1 NADH:flavin oxidoreductase/NADH oxidase family protein [Alteribacter keqinensis]
METSSLTTLLKSKTFTIKNRFFKAAMSEALATSQNNPTESLIDLYARWAKGGAGLLISGNVMVDRKAIGEPGNVAIEDERDLAMLKKWANAGTQHDTHLWVQLNHPGKQTPKSVSKEPVAPSAVPLFGGTYSFNKPRALTTHEIWEIIKRFGRAAKVVKKAGFTGVQIHSAHGYLISQFLSPHHNQRTDEWGGELNHRMQFLLKVYQEIRKQVGDDFPIGIKLNSADFQRGGFTEEESMDVLKIMDEAGIDLIEISGGNYENPKMLGGDVKKSTKEREAYFLEYAEKARHFIRAPFVVTGGFRSGKAMVDAIESGFVDMVGIGKPFALNPDLPNQIIDGSYETVNTKPIKTGIKSLDNTISSMLELTWYEQQLARMGKGKDPDPDLSPWKTLVNMIVTHGTAMLHKRRI